MGEQIQFKILSMFEKPSKLKKKSAWNELNILCDLVPRKYIAIKFHCILSYM